MNHSDMENLSDWYNISVQGKLLAREHVQKVYNMALDRGLENKQQLLLLSVMYNMLRNGQLVDGDKGRALTMMLVEKLRHADPYNCHIMQKCIFQLTIHCCPEESHAMIQGLRRGLADNDIKYQTALLEILIKLMSKQSTKDVKKLCHSCIVAAFTSIFDTILKKPLDEEHTLLHCAFLKLWSKLAKFQTKAKPVNKQTEMTVAEELGQRSKGMDLKQHSEDCHETQVDENAATGKYDMKHGETDVKTEENLFCTNDLKLKDTHDKTAQNTQENFDNHLTSQPLVMLEDRCVDYLINTALKQSQPYCAYRALHAMSHYMPYSDVIAASKKTVPTQALKMSKAVVGQSEQMLVRLPILPVRGFCDTMADRTVEDKDNNVVLRKIALLVLRAVAVQAKHGIPKMYPGLVSALHSLDRVMSAHSTEWMEDILAEQDDVVIEALLCIQDSQGVLRSFSEDLPEWYDPHGAFILLLRIAGWDHTVLLDWITSPETCCLLYVHRYLHHLTTHWQEFYDIYHHTPLEERNCDTDAESSSEFDSSADRNNTSNSSLDCHRDASKMNQKVKGLKRKLSPAELDPDLGEYGKCETVCQRSSVKLTAYSSSDESSEEFEPKRLKRSEETKPQDTEISTIDHQNLLECKPQKSISKHETLLVRKGYKQDVNDWDEERLENVTRKTGFTDIQHENIENSTKKPMKEITDEPNESKQLDHRCEIALKDIEITKLEDENSDEEDLDITEKPNKSEQLNQKCEIASQNMEIRKSEDENSEEEDLAILERLKTDTDVFSETVVDRVMTVLIQLKLSIEKLVGKQLLVVPAGKLLRLLETCEALYEGS